MQEQNPYRKLTVHKPEGARRVGRSTVRWLDSVEEDTKKWAIHIGDESHRIGQMARNCKKRPRFIMDCSVSRK
jgi:hypothetical protein